ncbi:MAG: hypothetical protein R3C58_10130 [Parvularculaceae bacterium]
MAEAGYSGTPLLKKLGVKDGMTALLVAVPEEVGPLAQFDGWKKAKRTAKTGAASGGPYDYIHLFTSKRADYASAIPVLKNALAPNGMIWASWPKKSSGVPCDMTDADIRSLGLKAGLVDIKVCAVNEIWSGLKFVIPVKDRKK